MMISNTHNPILDSNKNGYTAALQGFIADILASNRLLDLLKLFLKYHVRGLFHFSSDQKTNYNCLLATTAPVPPVPQ